MVTSTDNWNGPVCAVEFFCMHQTGRLSIRSIGEFQVRPAFRVVKQQDRLSGASSHSPSAANTATDCRFYPENALGPIT